jgi:hypothetical protein
LTYTGPIGAVRESQAARNRASRAASGLAGCASHFTYGRTMAPWSCAVWIHSIHGRRFAASTGPVAPSTITGMRSHQALKIAMVAWNSPTLLCTAASIGVPVTLAQPWAMATACSSCRHSSICGAWLPRWFTRLSCRPR